MKSSGLIVLLVESKRDSWDPRSISQQFKFKRQNWWETRKVDAQKRFKQSNLLKNRLRLLKNRLSLLKNKLSLLKNTQTKTKESKFSKPRNEKWAARNKRSKSDAQQQVEKSPTTKRDCSGTQSLFKNRMSSSRTKFVQEHPTRNEKTKKISKPRKGLEWAMEKPDDRLRAP